jgi:hypothetical protein
MMDTYQAIYDATRSKIGHFDGASLRDAIARQFDFSMYADLIKDDFSFAAWQMKRPCVLFRPKIFIDGNRWCALYGENLQDGVAGFGDTPEKAMDDFDSQWKEAPALLPTPGVR